MCLNNSTKFKYLLTTLFFVSHFSFIQGQTNALVLNGAYININGGTWANPVYLVVNNGLPAAIKRNASGGHIISEGEGNYVAWNTNNAAAANYVFPFGYSNTDYLPVTIHKTSIAADAIIMSTWATAPDNTPWASTVTGMFGLGGSTATNSVIDRTWQILAPATVTATGDVSYRGVENTTTVSPTGTFNGQEWYIIPNVQWNVGSGAGVGVTAGIGTVTGITLLSQGTTVSSPYVLSANTSPLPIELVSFTANCENYKTKIKWIDASETNVMNIELQKSVDLNSWTTIYVAQPHNQSSASTYNYSYSETNSSIVYYRLKTNNYDGGFDISNSISNQPCDGVGNTLSAFYYDNLLNIVSNFASDGKVNYSLFDAQGKRIFIGEYIANKGEERITLPVDQLASGIYLFNAQGNNNFFNQKIVISR